MEEGRQNIGIVTFPMSQRGDVVLLKFVNLLSPFANDFYIITGKEGRVPSGGDKKKVYTYRLEHRPGTDVFSRVFRYIWTQLRISYKLAKLTKKAHLWIFHTGGEYLLLPMLTAKLWRKKVMLLLVGPGIDGFRAVKEPTSRIMVFLARINCALSDRVITYSEKFVEAGGLAKYKDKISIAYEYYLNLDTLKVQKPLIERANLIGYIGGLSKEKGILNFLQAITKVMEEKSNIEFLIGGDGPQQAEVKDYLTRVGLTDEVKFVGWIAHEKLPKYLNELKLLVLPSYTEGLPGMVLEAMACGTPVLATPVGAISDVIKEGETGFIMENNSPECIAKNIITALKHPKLGEIAKNARTLIEQRYNYEAMLDKWRVVLKELE